MVASFMNEPRWSIFLTKLTLLSGINHSFLFLHEKTYMNGIEPRTPLCYWWYCEARLHSCNYASQESLPQLAEPKDQLPVCNWETPWGQPRRAFLELGVSFARWLKKTVILQGRQTFLNSPFGQCPDHFAEVSIQEAP